jgi:Tfp pilus assembly protein PilF
MRLPKTTLLVILLLSLLISTTCTKEKDESAPPAPTPAVDKTPPKAGQESSFSAGRKALFAKDWLTAKSHFEEVKPDDPNYLLALHNLAILSEKLSDRSGAIAYHKKILEIEPKNADAHANLGWLYFLEGDYEKSIKESHSALTGNPNLWTAFYNLGLAHAADENYAAAIEVYKRVLSLDQRKSGIEAAKEDLAGFISSHSAAEAPRLCLAYLYGATGHFEKEEEELEKLLKMARSEKLKEKARKRLADLKKGNR